MSGLPLQHQTPKGRGRGKTRGSNASDPNGPALLSMEGNEEKNCSFLPSNSSASSQSSTRASCRGQGRPKKPEMLLYVPRARREQGSSNGTAHPHNPEKRDHSSLDKTACSYSTNWSDSGDQMAKKGCKIDEKFESVCLDLQSDCSEQKISELKSFDDSQEGILNRSELSPKKASTVKGSRPDVRLYVPRARRKPDKAENAEEHETNIREHIVKMDHSCISSQSDVFDNSVSPCKSHRIADENTVVPYSNSVAADATFSPVQAQSSQQMSLDNVDAARTKFMNDENIEDGLGGGDGVVFCRKDMEAQPGFFEASKASGIMEKENKKCNISDKGLFSAAGKHWENSQGNDGLLVSLKHDQSVGVYSEQPVKHADESPLVSTSVPSHALEGMLQEQHVVCSDPGKNFGLIQSGDENVPKKKGNSLPEEIVFWDRSSEGSSHNTSASEENNYQQIEQQENSSHGDSSQVSFELLDAAAGASAQGVLPEERQLSNLLESEVLESQSSTDSETVPPLVDIQCNQVTLENMCFKDQVVDGLGENSTSEQEVMSRVGDCDKHKQEHENDIMLDVSSNASLNCHGFQHYNDASMKAIGTEVSSGKKENNLVGKGDNEEEDSWDTIFDDNGDCLNPSVMEELTAHVGDVKINMPKAKINYLSYQAREPDMDMEAFSHVIEISDFPVEFQTRDLLGVFKDYMSRGFDIKWVDDTHALGVFSSATAAFEALKMVHPLMKLRPLSEASKQSRAKARRCQEFLQPYKPRPETTAAAARRLVIGALGMSPRISKEQRDQEQKQLKEAREKKRQDKKLKDDMWDGILGSCAMDGQ